MPLRSTVNSETQRQKPESKAYRIKHIVQLGICCILIADVQALGSISNPTHGLRQFCLSTEVLHKVCQPSATKPPRTCLSGNPDIDLGSYRLDNLFTLSFFFGCVGWL